MNEWSLGQIWDNLIIVQGRTTFEEEKVTVKCDSGENMLESSRGERAIHTNIMKRALQDGWEISTIDNINLSVISKQRFNRHHAQKVPVFVINASMASKCWKQNSMDQCWQMPAVDKDGMWSVEDTEDSSAETSSDMESSSIGGSSSYESIF